MIKPWIKILLVATLLLSGACAQAKALRIAVAANFAKPVQTLATQFEAKTGNKVNVVVGSSGALFAQISHGAPFDVFFSADSQRPMLLAERGLAVAGSVQPYALGRLVLLDAKNPSPALSELSNMAALQADRKLAIANPKLAPYGAAAKELLSSLGVWDQSAPQIVMGSNVLQTYQYFTTGNVDLALVAYSLVAQTDNKGTLVPASFHTPIVQKLALMSNAASPDIAQDFIHFVLAKAQQAQLSSWGYSAVAPANVNAAPSYSKEHDTQTSQTRGEAL